MIEDNLPFEGKPCLGEMNKVRVKIQTPEQKDRWRFIEEAANEVRTWSRLQLAEVRHATCTCGEYIVYLDNNCVRCGVKVRW